MYTERTGADHCFSVSLPIRTQIHYGFFWVAQWQIKLTKTVDRLTSHKLSELQTEVTIMACDVLFSDVSSQVRKNPHVTLPPLRNFRCFYELVIADVEGCFL